MGAARWALHEQMEDARHATVPPLGDNKDTGQANESVPMPHDCSSNASPCCHSCNDCIPMLNPDDPKTRLAAWPSQNASPQSAKIPTYTSPRVLPQPKCLGARHAQHSTNGSKGCSPCIPEHQVPKSTNAHPQPATKWRCCTLPTVA